MLIEHFLLLLGDGESAYPHDFKRDPSTFTCYACFDMWAPNQTSVCKCYTCSRCGEFDATVSVTQLIIITVNSTNDII